MKAADLARDDPRCWICGGDVDLGAPPAAAAAATVDHVVPRARGGTSDRANLRLAHRRCNGRRGSRLPELDWPADLGCVDTTPLWPVVGRARRRRGTWENVAVVGDEVAAAAAARWLLDRLALVVPDRWETRRTAHGPLTVLALRAAR
jgi:hypothetical protein